MVGIEGILKHIPSKLFFAVLEPFLNETAFYAKLLGGFWVLKPKSRNTTR